MTKIQQYLVTMMIVLLLLLLLAVPVNGFAESYQIGGIDFKTQDLVPVSDGRQHTVISYIGPDVQDQTRKVLCRVALLFGQDGCKATVDDAFVVFSRFKDAFKSNAIVVFGMDRHCKGMRGRMGCLVLVDVVKSTSTTFLIFNVTDRHGFVQSGACVIFGVFASRRI